MDGYVSKPIVPEDLIAAIDNQLLGDSASRRGATAGNSPLAQSPAPESSAPGPAPINRSELLQRCLGRESLAAKLLDKFSQQLPQQVQQITEAVRQGSAAQAAQLAHALKGAAANLAAEPVRQAAAELEGLLRAGKLSQAAAPLAKVQQEVRRCLEHLPVVQASLAVTTRGGSPGANTDRG